MSDYHQPDLRALKEYATTDRQLMQLTVIEESGSVTDAALALGISERALRGTLARLRKIRDAHESGSEFPGSQFMMPGQDVAGISAMVKNSEGLPTWVKFAKNKASIEEELEAVRASFVDSLPREKAVAKRKGKTDPDLLNLYLLTDYHIGMKAWGEETGADWDTSIAEKLIYDWFAQAISRAPDSETAVLGQLGDFLHWDGIDAITPMSGHLLDADTRFQRLVRVSIRALRRVVRELLRKHDKVHLLLAEGNHDMASSMWLREVFNQFYDDEPRLTVETSPDPFYCYEFGLVSLFFHHGHKVKMNLIDQVFAAKFREIFGRTKYSYGHMGHLHHQKVLEKYLMEIEQHQTLAAPDAYASRGGYMSQRSAKVITYHRDYGEIERKRIPPEMV